MKTVSKLLIAAIAVGGFVTYQQYAHKQPNNQPARYKMQPVDRGDIQRVISANGTLNPTIQVNVGTQVSGTVKVLHVDFNSQVKAGQVLAELDPSLLEAAAAQSRANLASAQAQFAVAQSKFTRSNRLFQQGFIS